MAQFPTSDEIQLWYHYEEIAMHFNNIIMQYRLQVMGGFGAIGAVASYLIGARVENEQEQNWLRLLVSAGLFTLLLAAASLDLLYYNKLLLGAVVELKRFEADHPAIQMSTRIENVVGSGRYAILVVYDVLLGLLSLYVFWAGRHWNSHRRATPAEQVHGNRLVGASLGAAVLTMSLISFWSAGQTADAQSQPPTKPSSAAGWRVEAFENGSITVRHEGNLYKATCLSSTTLNPPPSGGVTRYPACDLAYDLVGRTLQPFGGTEKDSNGRRIVMFNVGDVLMLQSVIDAQSPSRTDEFKIESISVANPTTSRQ